MTDSLSDSGVGVAVEENAADPEDQAIRLYVQYESFLPAHQLSALMWALSEMYSAFCVDEEHLGEPVLSWRSEDLPLQVDSIHTGESITIVLGGGAAIAATGPLGWAIAGAMAAGGVVTWILKRRIDIKKADALEAEAKAHQAAAEAHEAEAKAHEADAEVKVAEANLLRAKARKIVAKAARIEQGISKSRLNRVDEAADNLDNVLKAMPNVKRIILNGDDLDIPKAS